MGAEIAKLDHYFQVAEDITVKNDGQFLTRYILFLEDLTALYNKGPSALSPSTLEKLSEFIRDFVPASIRSKHIDLYRYQPYMVKTVTSEIDGFQTTDFKFVVTSSEEDAADPVEVVANDPRLQMTLAYASVIDDLPIHSPRIRNALKSAYSEEQLKALINQYRQKNPEATDIDVAKYLATEVYPNIKSMLDHYDFNDEEKQSIREHLTEAEIRAVIDAFETAKQTNRGLSELDLKRMMRDAIRRKLGRKSAVSVVDELDLSPIDKDILKNKFTEQQLREIIDRFKQDHPGASRNELTAHFEMILDEYAALSVEHILTLVGKKKFDGDDNDDSQVYTDQKSRGTKGQDQNVKRIPPTMVTEGIPEHIQVNEPKDLYKALDDYTERGRVVFKTQEYATWYPSLEVATWVAFKVQRAEPFDNNTFGETIKLPTIFKITLKDPDKMIVVSPHKLMFLFQTYNADFLRKNYEKDKRGLRELRLAAVRLLRVFKQKGMFSVIVHHSDPFKKVIPMQAYQAEPQKAKLVAPPVFGSKKCATLLEGLLKL